MSRRSNGFLWASCLVGALGACDEAEAPLGPPRCEPPRELVLERFLKEGFRALAEGHADEAKIRFNAVLVEESAHPEALFGMRLSQHGAGIAPSTASDAGPSHGSVVIAGQVVPVGLAVDTSRFRFEDVQMRRHYAREHDLDDVKLPMDGWYENRLTKEGVRIEGNDREAVARAVDLVVLHDTRTLDALEAMAQMEASGGSTHFVIDWDGAVYQTLDLAWEANHSHRDAIDHRSVSIDLVNPVVLESAPLPPAAKSAGVERPLSEFVVVQGQEVQEWGYTAEQLAALKKLLRALGDVLPAVPLRVPRDAAAGDKVPRQFVPGLGDFVGVLGHLHLSPTATDPGPGFDWEAFGRDL
ncbi:MAG: N-acetylmuramoyl-L-alanine amidase [Myxococcota bacterium]